MIEWISTLVDKATSFVPRFEKVTPPYRMVKWSRCCEGTIHGPGIVWYWPLVTEVITCDVRWTSTMTTVQSVTTKDGVTVSARTLTIWRPSDLLKAVSENSDYCDRIAETAQSVLVDVLSSVESKSLVDTGSLSGRITKSMNIEAADIGLKVKRCKLTELCVSPAFRLINDA